MKLAHLGWKSSHTLMGQRRPSSWPPPIPLCSLATLRPGALSSRALTPISTETPSPSPSRARSAGPGAARRPRWPPGWRRSPAAGAWPGGPGCWRAGCWCRSRSRTPGWGWSGSAGPHPCRRPRRRPAGKAPRCPGRCGQRAGQVSAEAPPALVGARNTRPDPLAPPGADTHPPADWKTAGSDAAGRGAARAGDLPGSGWEGVPGETREGPTYTLSSLAASYTPTVMVRWLRALLSTSSRASPTLSILHAGQRKGSRQSPSLGAVAARSPCTATLPPECMSPCASQLSANPRPPSPFMTPRSWESREKPQECHPPPSPEGAASPWRRALTEDASCRSRTGKEGPSTLCKGSEGLSRAGGHALFVRGHPWEGPPRGRKMRGITSANFCTLTPPQASHSPAALGCTAGQSSGRGSGRLTFRSLALQQRIPPKSYCNCRSPTERERRGSSCTLGRAGAGSVLPHRLLQRPPPPRSPPRPPGSFARHLRAPLSVPPGAAQPTPQLPHSHWRTKAPAYRSYPANPQPTTSSLICIRAAIGLCKSALETIWPQLLEQGWGAEGGGAARKLARGAGAGLGYGGRGLELTHPFGRVCRTGVLCLGGEWGRVVVFSLGWSWLPSVFLVGAHFFFYCSFMSFVFRGCY